MFQDFYIFYQAGQAIAAGLSPYTVPGYFNPIQAAWLLSFTTFLPFQVWAWILVALSAAGVILLARKAAIWYLISAPFIFGAYMGMLDVLLWIPARLLGGPGLALLTLKPQLAMIYIPFRLLEWKRAGDWKQIRLFVISILALWGIPTAINPAWIRTWLAAMPTLESRMHGAASLAGYIVIFDQPVFYVVVFALVMGVLLWKGSNTWPLAMSFSPALNPVDWVMASEFWTWRLTILSWILTFAGVGIEHFQLLRGSQALFILGICIWWTSRRALTRARLAVEWTPLPGPALAPEFDLLRRQYDDALVSALRLPSVVLAHWPQWKNKDSASWNDSGDTPT